jgi:hypothetical protein
MPIQVEGFMKTKQIDELIAEAHTIFNATSIYEVIDLENRQAAVIYLNKTYKNPTSESINQYLDLVETVNSL